MTYFVLILSVINILLFFIFLLKFKSIFSTDSILEKTTKRVDKIIAELNEDDMYLFYGKTVDHPRYGIQFEVTNYERLKPDDVDGLVEFLSNL